MLEYGFEPDEPPEAAAQLSELARHSPPVVPGPDARDLRDLFWSSIDNDTSRDLDQLEVADPLADGSTRVRVAIAEVDAFVPKGSPIDWHAARETTTVYAGVLNCPMLPELLSTGATSLQEAADRLAIVSEFVLTSDGHVQSSAVYRAVVRHKAPLAYNSVGAWLEGHGRAPSKGAVPPDQQSQLRVQNQAAHSPLGRDRLAHRPSRAAGRRSVGRPMSSIAQTRPPALT